MCPFETFDHTADLGLHVTASDLPELFEESARALFSAIVDAPPSGGPAARRIEIRGERLDHLLFDWLGELLWLFDSEHLVLGEFTVELVAHGLVARVSGVPLDPTRHQVLHEVKAITYHGLKVERRDVGWVAEFIVDI